MELDYLNENGVQRLWSHVIAKQTETLEAIQNLNATDVGAMQAAAKGANGDFNSLIEPGCYRIDAGWVNGPSAISTNYGQVLVVRGHGDTVAQIAFNYYDSQASIRSGQSYYGDYTTMTWYPWRTILTSGETFVIGSQNYGTELPASGVEGQIFFKQVT